MEINSIQQYRKSNLKRRKKRNRVYYIYNKLSYFLKDYCFANVMKKIQIYSILRDYFKVEKNIKKEEIAINKYIPKPNSKNKYFFPKI